jgi:hypothetical protein
MVTVSPSAVTISISADRVVWTVCLATAASVRLTAGGGGGT